MHADSFGFFKVRFQVLILSLHMHHFQEVYSAKTYHSNCELTAFFSLTMYLIFVSCMHSDFKISAYSTILNEFSFSIPLVYSKIHVI